MVLLKLSETGGWEGGGRYKREKVKGTGMYWYSGQTACDGSRDFSLCMAGLYNSTFLLLFINISTRTFHDNCSF